MATAQSIILRALRLCNVATAGESMNADDAQDALDVLNGLLAEWHEASIGLPDYSFAALTDPLASDAADAEAIAHQLALRMADEYGQPLSDRLERNAAESMARMRLRYFQPGTAQFDLPQDYLGRYFNITTGDY